MKVQNFEPTSGILRNFQDFCKLLEATLDDPPADNRSNKTSGQEKGTKKRRWNNNNNKDKINHCMLHGYNPTHSTEQCRTLKRKQKTQKRSQKWQPQKYQVRIQSQQGGDSRACSILQRRDGKRIQKR